MLIKALKNVGPVDAGSYLPDEVVNTPGFDLQRLLDLGAVEVESGYTPAVDHELLAQFALQGERDQLQKEREEFEQAKAAFQVERDQLLANTEATDADGEKIDLREAYEALLIDLLSIIPTSESALKGLTEPALRIAAKHLGIEAQPENKAELIALIMLAQKKDS